MSENTDFSFLLAILAPFIAAVIAPTIHRFAKDYAGWVLAIVPLSIFIFLCSFIPQIVQQNLVSLSVSWITIYGIDLTFWLDGLSLTFGLMISGIGFFIVLYAGAYLRGHQHQGRFFAFLLMFMGSMLGLVMADNLIVLFVFWEMTSITSFLLIGFDHRREASRRAAIQALVITGGGGLSLLAGVALLQTFTGVWNISDLHPLGAALRETDLYLPILLLFLGGAFAKSAQFPLHFWLPNAMEAPTPVSAYLHSATMVKAGVYLLARTAPIFGGTIEWGVILTIFGGITLLWGAVFALKQTDLKLMLAQTTVASLGLMVLLLGMFSQAAISAVVLFLLAHACYKGALFMIAGGIDHATGTRDITILGGLRAAMPVTFVATLLAAIGMAGLPLTMGFWAKEEMYAAVLLDGWSTLFLQPQNLAVGLALFLGNGLMMAVGLAIAIKVFFGAQTKTPIAAHEGSISLWIGPILLGIFSIVAGFSAYTLGHDFVVPAGSPILNAEIEPHLEWTWKILSKPAFHLSVLTWAIGIFFFLNLARIRAFLESVVQGAGISFDAIFDFLIFGLVRLADAITRFFHHGRLEFYLTIVFVALAASLFLPLILLGASFEMPSLPQLYFYEWAIFAIAVVGLVAVVAARTRLQAIVSLGIQGFAVAIIFLLFGAADLAFTQFMVETLSVVILALVMTRLHLDQSDQRVRGDVIRDGLVSVAVGGGVFALMIFILRTDLDLRLTELFAATSVPLAHGRNIVNVILVDYRGLDTLGEISVVMTTGIAILALIRIRGGGPQTGVGSKSAAHKRATTQNTLADTSNRAGGSA